MDELDALLAGLGDDDDFGAIGSLGNAEIIGNDYALGSMESDLDAILGAAAQAKPQQKDPRALARVAAKMAKLREIDPNAILVRQQRLDRRRRFPLGFERKVITGGDTDVVTAQPQTLVRPERIVVPSNFAFDFFVEDIKVGQQSQLVSSNPIPAAIFSEVAIDTNIHFKTAEIGNTVTMQITNDTGEDVNFGAAVIGTVAM